MAKHDMPELKAGMVIEIEACDDGKNFGLFLYVSDSLVMSLCGKQHQPLSDGVRVIKVYQVCAGMNFEWISSNIAKQTPIWTRQSTEKTEALTQLAEMQAKVDELKTTIEGME